MQVLRGRTYRFDEFNVRVSLRAWSRNRRKMEKRSPSIILRRIMLSLSDRMSRRSDESSTVARAAVVRASVSYRPLALSQGCSASLGARRLAYSSSSLAKATPHADARVERRRRVGTRYTSRDDPGARRRHRRGYRPFVEFDRRGGVGVSSRTRTPRAPRDRIIALRPTPS